jgi:quinolinate synthase
MNNNSVWKNKGFAAEPISADLNLVEEIERLKKEKNAIIMAHYYQDKEVQDIADFVGDSLALAQQAAKTDADVIMLAGVYFMGETAKILSPDKKVLIPDFNAGCSLADSAPTADFEAFVNKYPNHEVVTYVNTTAAVKALSDVVVTSTNALGIINSIAADQPILFGPDRNLGNYLESLSGRKMVLWDGACHVHEKFSIDKISALKKQYPDAEILAHPECKAPLLIMADFVGSTAALLKYSICSDKNTFIVATESGILHQMQKMAPDKTFIPAPPLDSSCGCNDCEFMKLNTLQKVYLALKYEYPEVFVEESIRVKALRPIERMLKISESLKL